MSEYEDEQVLTVVRHHNRALRRVNKSLRDSHKLNQEYNDALFEELCSHNTDAELALRKLWEEGGLQLSCSSEDYTFIVDSAIRALNVQRTLEAIGQPTQSH